MNHPLPYQLFIFDADGTLRRCTVPGQPCPNRPGEWELLPNVAQTLGQYNWVVKDCAIVSNQGGIALGYLTDDMAQVLLADTLNAATGFPVHRRQVWLCPHAPQAGCACRKPAPLLLEQAQMWSHSQGRLHGPEQVVFIGDQESDRKAAQRAGIAFVFAEVFFGWEDMPCLTP